MASPYGGITRIRFEGFLSPDCTTASGPPTQGDDYNPLAHESRADAPQHGRAADPHLGGARPGRARPAVHRAARGVRAAEAPRARVLRPGDSRSGERRAHVAAEARGARAAGARASHKTDRVLEVGTGSGYLTALLAHRAAQVCIGRDQARARAHSAARNLERHGVDNVTLEIGDAARGWTAHAPYDVIVLTGSTPVLPARVPRAAQARRAAVRRGRRGAGDDRAARQLQRPGRMAPTTCSRPWSRRSPTPSSRRVSGSELIEADQPRRSSPPGSPTRPRKAAAARRARAWEFETRASRARSSCRCARYRRASTSSTSEREVVAICHHGGRSQQVAMFLEKNGFAKMHNCRGAWMPGHGPSIRRSRFTSGASLVCCSRCRYPRRREDLFAGLSRRAALRRGLPGGAPFARRRPRALPAGPRAAAAHPQPVAPARRARASSSTRDDPSLVPSFTRYPRSVGYTLTFTQPLYRYAELVQYEQAESRCARPKRPSARPTRT